MKTVAYLPTERIEIGPIPLVTRADAELAAGEAYDRGYAQAVKDWKGSTLEDCDIPPNGWICTRGKGHTGPCAAIPTGEIS